MRINAIIIEAELFTILHSFENIGRPYYYVSDSEFSKPKAEESEKLQASPLNHGKPKQSFDSRSKKPENNAPVDDSPQSSMHDPTYLIVN